MKKCAKCGIIFKSDDRTRCLYCSALLMTASEKDKVGQEPTTMGAGDSPIEQIARDKKLFALAKMEYLMGSYFKTRTLNFMYRFYRNECKMGSKFKRFLIQPVSLSSFLIIPWVVIDVIDSLFFRLSYQYHCKVCNWKYTPAHGNATRHDVEECEYNKEYTTIMDDIKSGKIGQIENIYKQKAADLESAGKRSAYYDLVKTKTKHQAALDIACIWLSTTFFLGGFVWLTFPLILDFIIHLE